MNLNLIPDHYVKNISQIPYQQLKEKNVKCLIFDLDNTLALLSEKECPKRVEALISKLKKEFQVFMITNSTKKRAHPYQEKLKIPVISMAMKPSTLGLKRIAKKYQFKKQEMVMIGDQLMTDILSGKKFGIRTVLVDPLGEKDLKITKLNRMIENKIIKRYQKKGLFERGKYYE